VLGAVRCPDSACAPLDDVLNWAGIGFRPHVSPVVADLLTEDQSEEVHHIMGVDDRRRG
jgi:hypothetical protein